MIASSGLEVWLSPQESAPLREPAIVSTPQICIQFSGVKINMKASHDFTSPEFGAKCDWNILTLNTRDKYLRA